MSNGVTPAQFIAKWSPVELSEAAASQEHFLDLCRLLGQPTPAEHDPTGEEYSFAKGVAVAETGVGAGGRMTQSAGVVASDVANETCCPHCGYSLRGLTLPRPCPECGTPFESEAACHAAAVAWYASWNGFWFRRPPPLVMPHLGDPACRRVARRRLLLGLLLPLLAVTALMLGLNSIEVVHNMERWYELPERPGERLGVNPRHTHRDRPLAFNLHLFCGLFEDEERPAGAVFHERELSHSIHVTWPHPDFVTRAWLVVPTTTMLLAPLLLALAIHGFQRWQRRRLARAQHTVLPTLAFLTPWLPIGWLGVAAAAVATGIGEVYGYDFAWLLGHALEFLLLPAVSVVLIGGAYVLVRTVCGWYPPLRGPNRLLCFVGALAVWGGLFVGTCLGVVWVVEKVA